MPWCCVGEELELEDRVEDREGEEEGVVKVLEEAEGEVREVRVCVTLKVGLSVEVMVAELEVESVGVCVKGGILVGVFDRVSRPTPPKMEGVGAALVGEGVVLPPPLFTPPKEVAVGARGVTEPPPPPPPPEDPLGNRDTVGGALGVRLEEEVTVEDRETRGDLEMEGEAEPVWPPMGGLGLGVPESPNAVGVRRGVGVRKGVPVPTLERDLVEECVMEGDMEAENDWGEGEGVGTPEVEVVVERLGEGVVLGEGREEGEGITGVMDTLGVEVPASKAEEVVGRGEGELRGPEVGVVMKGGEAVATPLSEPVGKGEMEGPRGEGEVVALATLGVAVPPAKRGKAPGESEGGAVVEGVRVGG